MPLSFICKSVIVEYLNNKKDLKMKRITTILAIGTTALFFTACGGGSSSDNTQPPIAGQPPVEQPHVGQPPVV